MSEMSKFYGSKAEIRVYAKLIEVATYRGLITYEEIAALDPQIPKSGSAMGRAVGEILGDIVLTEAKFGRGMLSAIAVSVTTKEPSDGFYALAETMGLFSGAGKSERKAFWHEQRDMVYRSWELPR